jgi:Leucine-rich repeat (LRR) protein
VELRFDPTRQPREPIHDLLPLAGLQELKTLSIHEVRSLTDDDMGMVSSLPELTYLVVSNCMLTDAALPMMARARNLVHLSVFGNLGVNGATLPSLLELGKLTHLKLEYCQLSDSGISHLAQFTRLEELGVGGPNFTDAKLPVLDGMRKLKSLSVESSPVTLAGVASRASLIGLTRIAVLIPAGGVKANWAALAKTCPGLEELTLSVAPGGTLTAEELSELGSFPRLKYLWLNRDAVSDTSLAGLLELKSLQQLLLVNQSITDAAIEDLLAHRALREITFNVSQITDVGLARLAQIKGLQKVELLSCPKVTDAGIAALRKARSDINVTVLR